MFPKFTYHIVIIVIFFSQAAEERAKQREEREEVCKLVTSSSQEAGDANSRFMDVNGSRKKKSKHKDDEQLEKSDLQKSTAETLFCTNRMLCSNHQMAAPSHDRCRRHINQSASKRNSQVCTANTKSDNSLVSHSTSPQPTRNKNCVKNTVNGLSNSDEGGMSSGASTPRSEASVTDSPNMSKKNKKARQTLPADKPTQTSIKTVSTTPNKNRPPSRGQPTPPVASVNSKKTSSNMDPPQKEKLTPVPASLQQPVPKQAKPQYTPPTSIVGGKSQQVNNNNKPGATSNNKVMIEQVLHAQSHTQATNNKIIIKSQNAKNSQKIDTKFTIPPKILSLESQQPPAPSHLQNSRKKEPTTNNNNTNSTTTSKRSNTSATKPASHSTTCPPPLQQPPAFSKTSSVPPYLATVLANKDVTNHSAIRSPPAGSAIKIRSMVTDVAPDKNASKMATEKAHSPRDGNDSERSEDRSPKDQVCSIVKYIIISFNYKY